MVKTFLNRVGYLARQPDLLLIAVFATILLMMILPLPSLLMDILITLNITASIIILIMALQLKEPVQFTTFPSLLLLTTLFRLAISISTTRLILLEGSAGQIVETFGNVVVGGNLVVGLVIFLIITVVQFLVITKGADRVAEVGARFTLDGMPGKQMSVDADVRAGNLDNESAKLVRSNLERETKLFGAMDGAMKFVKGDATAGLVITAINLIGGIAIGMSQFGYSFSGALELYALLTIGDGLVAQIPALLISVSAGTIVTRVTNPNGSDLASEISEQITTNQRNLSIAGIVIALFGFVPGFPTLIFATVGLTISIGVTYNAHILSKRSKEQLLTWDGLIVENHQWCKDQHRKTGSPIKLNITLPRAIRNHDPQMFYLLLSDVRAHSEAEFGIPMGLWRLEINDNFIDKYEISISGEVVLANQLKIGQVFVKASPAYLEGLGVPSTKHFGDEEGALVEDSLIPHLIEENVEYFEDTAMFLMDIRTTIGRYLHLMIDIQTTSLILDQIKRSDIHLSREIDEKLDINQVSTNLKLLFEERIPFHAPSKILEALLEWSQRRTDPYEILQQVRLSISKYISYRNAPDGFLQCIVIAPTLEGYIREGFRNSDDQRFLIIENSISAHIAKRVKELRNNHAIRGQSPVIISQQDVRRALFNVLQQHGIYATVLAYQEITPETTIYPVAFIGPEENWETS